MCVFITGTNVWWVSSSGGQAARSARWPLGTAVLLMDGCSVHLHKVQSHQPTCFRHFGFVYHKRRQPWNTSPRKKNKGIYPSISFHSPLRPPSILDCQCTINTIESRCKKILSTAPLGFQEKIHIPEFRRVLAPLRWSTGQICVVFVFYCGNLAAHVRASHTRLRKWKCQRSTHIRWFFAGGAARTCHFLGLLLSDCWQNPS